MLLIYRGWHSINRPILTAMGKELCVYILKAILVHNSLGTFLDEKIFEMNIVIIYLDAWYAQFYSIQIGIAFPNRYLYSSAILWSHALFRLIILHVLPF